MADYWLHRIKGGKNGWELSYPLLREHSILSTGWSDFSEEAFVKDVKTRGMVAIEERMHSDWNCQDGLPRNRWSLHRFLCQMHTGDIVVVPMGWGTFCICEIEDETIWSNESLDANLYKNLDITLKDDGYLYDQYNNCIDLGFYRKVKILGIDMARAKFASQKLLSRMKVQQTNTNIADLEEDVKDALERFRTNNPIVLRKELQKQTIEAMHGVITRWTNCDSFEELVSQYLYAIGADEVVKPAKNESPTEEGDADRIGIFETLKLQVIVQVKKHNQSTNEWGVQQVTAYLKNHEQSEYMTQLWLISNAEDFTEEAKRLAEGSNVRLIDGLEFARMILDVGLAKITM